MALPNATRGGADEAVDGHTGMADNFAVPSVGGVNRGHAETAWAPLREPLFRSLWIAAVISYTGTWMQNVGAGWLMTELTTSPLMVSLVQEIGRAHV